MQEEEDMTLGIEAEIQVQETGPETGRSCCKRWGKTDGQVQLDQGQGVRPCECPHPRGSGSQAPEEGWDVFD